MHAIAERMVQLVRGTGALANLPTYLAQVGITTTWMGDFEGAASVVAESDSVAAATGSRIAPYTLLRLRALQGQGAEASATIAKATELAAAAGQGMATAWASWAAATLENGLGHYAEAAAAAQKATSDSLNPWMAMWSLPELVEAAARSGQLPLATDALARLSETTRPVGNDSSLGIEARSRALLSEGDTADDLYHEAIDRLGRTRLRPELARAHLVYGEWLRREGRRVDAREQLRTAHDLLATIGMEAFAERARRELLATGETAPRRTVETRDVLTPQEAQIARMASDRQTNPEIGAKLFISPRTVEYHLHKVFTKLGIRSRKELRAALADAEQASAPA
jgi:DNA-binding CsgD family transcriptional regulator